MKTWITLPIVILLAGCQTDQPSIQPVDLSPLSTQIGTLASANSDLRSANEKLQAANAALSAENEHLKAMLRADADAGLAANSKGWLPFERYVWNHQIMLLPVAPDAQTVDKWGEASTIYSAGGESAMQRVIDGLNADAKTTNAMIGELSQRIEQLTKERGAAQAVADAALKRARDATDAIAAAVADATAGERARLEAETRAWQARSANWLGGSLGVFALVCIAGMIFFPEAAKLFRKAGIIAGVGSVALLALARFLSSPWFDAAWKVTLAAGAAGGIAWGLLELRSAIKRAREAKKAGEVAMVADTVILRLDTYYDNEASPEAKADMDEKLWPALQREGPAYDAAVKRIKAEQCDEKALAK